MKGLQEAMQLLTKPKIISTYREIAEILSIARQIESGTPSYIMENNIECLLFIGPVNCKNNIEMSIQRTTILTYRNYFLE